MRRRKPRVVWLPNSRSNRLNVIGDATAGTDSALFRIALDVPNDGTPVTGLIPVVADNQPNLGLAGPIFTLSDIENSGYRLRRIVGKLFISARQTNEQVWEHAIITCGFIILRVDAAGVPLANPASYATNALDSVADPWIWRRSYGLGNNAANLLFNIGTAFWPESNLTAGSALDGPHVDQKTARIVAAEERLFFVATGVSVGISGQQALISAIEVVGDVRVLATMRTSVGNRRNASR